MIWELAIEALTAATRVTDILGWVERQQAVAVVLTEISASRLTTACQEVEARIRRELARRLDAETMGRLSIRVDVHPEPGHSGESQPWSIDPVLYARLRPRGAGFQDALKRGLDVIGSAVLLVGLSPLFLLIAALVKSKSRGPVLFRQIRIGHMMKPFTMFKFRTMSVDADPKLHHDFVSSFISGNGQNAQRGERGFFKLTNDPRVTPIGRILRKTSLDELPQLWNVLRGDMSLVGPRPPLEYELGKYKPWHRRRVLDAKPGITGLWQVTGRSRTTFDEMVRLDLRYARARSLWTDIGILLATPTAVFWGKGAC